MRLSTTFAATVLALVSGVATAQQSGYHVLQTVRVGGDGGFDYVYADPVNRELYMPRGGANARIQVVNLDTLTPGADLPGKSGHGVASDAKYHVAFASTNPVTMWDSRTLKVIKTINVDGHPDGILNDAYNHRTYVFSHEAPNATVIDDSNGNVLGTIDLGGAPEQAQSDGHGHLFVDLEDQAAVAVVDANTMKVAGTYSLNGKGSGCAGLGLDAKNHVLFVACREPQGAMVMLDSRDGHYLASLPIGGHCDGVVFNPRTAECFSSQGDGTLTVIKETSPTTFVVEQTVTTLAGAKTLTLDPKTGHLLLITALYDSPATSAQGARPGRGAMVPGSFSVIVVGK